MRFRRSGLSLALLTAAFAALMTSAGRAEDARVTRLKLQRVGDDVYFRVLLSPPANLAMPQLDGLGSPALPWQAARLPQLIPQDDRTTAVYFVPGESNELEFIGRLTPPALHELGLREPPVKGLALAALVLVYPTVDEAALKSSAGTDLDRFFRGQTWGEKEVRLNLRRGEWMPHLNPRPSDPDLILTTNLERIWARAQATHFSILEAMTGGDGVYRFARETTNRKYKVQVEPFAPGSPREVLLNFDDGPRRFDVDRIAGIDAPERPWSQLLGGKKVSIDPSARLVPDDNWYLHFKTVRTLRDLAALLPLLNSTGRDDQLVQRYTRQLGLGEPETWPGPELLRDVALTGSDLYLREGSDLTLLFHVSDAGKFLAAMQPNLDALRREFGDKLRERRDAYLGVEIESFTTPFREVSLHRATVGEFVVCSNSARALGRVLDVQSGLARPLSDAPDYLYVRSVFPPQDSQEDGFAFLSESFVRRLLGPATWIKQLRRREALTRLHLLTNAALFSAWETGAMPRNQDEVMAAAGLLSVDLEVPEGRPVEWFAGRQEAVSERYNTLSFATPLLELPVGGVTRQERQGYEQFRDDAASLWRRGIEPMGVRLKMDETRVRAEALVLPLGETQPWKDLRWWTGGGTAFRAGGVPAGTLLYALSHVGPQVHKGLGEWASLRLNEGPEVSRLIDGWIRQALGVDAPDLLASDVAWLGYQLPWVAALQVGDAKRFQDLLAELKKYSTPILQVEWADGAATHRGITIGRVRALPDSDLARAANPTNTPPARQFLPAVYHAQVNGVCYVAFREDVLKGAIDRALTGASTSGGEAIDANGLLSVSSRGAATLREALDRWLRVGEQRQNLASEAWWHLLDQTGAVAPRATQQQAEAASLRLLGFVPADRGLALARLLRSVGSVQTEWRFQDVGLRAVIDLELKTK